MNECNVGMDYLGYCYVVKGVFGQVLSLSLRKFRAGLMYGPSTEGFV